MDILRTITIDITHTVFENDTVAIMYVTKDIYSDSFIIAIPVITFSFDIYEENFERDYDWLKKSVPIGDPVRKDKLVEVIKKVIAEF